MARNINQERSVIQKQELAFQAAVRKMENKRKSYKEMIIKSAKKAAREEYSQVIIYSYFDIYVDYNWPILATIADGLFIQYPEGNWPPFDVMKKNVAPCNSLARLP